MADIQFKILPGKNVQFSIDALGGSNPKTWEWSISDGFSNSGTGDASDSHTIASADINKNSVFTVNSTQTQGGGSAMTFQTKVRYPPTGALNFIGKTTNEVFTSVSHHGRVTFKGGTPNTSYTFLEELAKLDQYTKAQYVPYNR